MLAFIGFVLATAVVLLLTMHIRRQWVREVSTDFAAALQRLHVEGYEVLLDRDRFPGVNRMPEIYRILRSDDDRYFLYLYLRGSPGVLRPLAKERALLAVKLNG